MQNKNDYERIVRQAMSLNGLTRAQAEAAVRRRYPELSLPASSGAASGESAEAQLDRLAKRLAAEEGVSYAEGYARALNRNPNLYVRFLEEHLKRVEAAKRG